MSEEEINKRIQEEVDNRLRDIFDVISPDTIFIDRKTKVLDGRSIQVGTINGLKLGTTGTEKIFFISEVHMAGLPTSAAGLATGQLWNNSGVVNIA